MKDFWNDIFDIDWKQWRLYLVIIFLSAVAGTVVGVYLNEWSKYINLF